MENCQFAMWEKASADKVQFPWSTSICSRLVLPGVVCFWERSFSKNCKCCPMSLFIVCSNFVLLSSDLQMGPSGRRRKSLGSKLFYWKQQRREECVECIKVDKSLWHHYYVHLDKTFRWSYCHYQGCRITLQKCQNRKHSLFMNGKTAMLSSASYRATAHG